MHSAKLRMMGVVIVSAALATACSSSGGTADAPASSTEAAAASPTAGGGGTDPKTVTVAYNVNGDWPEPKTVLEAAKPAFEAANPGVTIELQPQTAPDDQFHTKMALTLKAGANVPCVIFYPSQFVDGDAAAGFLSPLDAELEASPDWGTQYGDATKTAVKASDGMTYVIPWSATTIGIWYNKEVLSKAGIPVPWNPTSWQDLEDAATAIKASNPDAIPVHLYMGKASGTTDSTLKTLRPLLYGAGKSLFTDGKWQPADQDWVAAWDFVQNLYEQELTAPMADVLSPNVWSNIGPWMKGNELGFVIDGNWMSYNWVEGGPSEWPSWGDDLGVTAIPARDGGAPIGVGLPGPGLARSAACNEPEAAMQFMQFATNMENSMAYNLSTGQLAVRADVAADPTYADSPTVPEFTAMLGDAQYIPATEVSGRVQAMLADINEQIALGALSPEEAAQLYNEQVIGIVGEENFAG